MARSYAKRGSAKGQAKGPRDERRTSACGRDCWICHGPRARNARTAERRRTAGVIRAELADVTPLGPCAHCDSDPTDQVRCYE